MSRRPALPGWCRIVRDNPAEYEREVFAQRTPVRSPKDAYALLSPRLEREEVEAFVAVLLDTQHRCISVTEVSRGVVNSSLVHPREVFRLAIVFGASAIIVAHNHPSGDPSPSVDDRAVTDQLVATGRMLDIPLHDHIVVGAGRYVSFAEAGLLQ